MVVLVLRNAKPGFRGELSRWLLEVAPGVLVGNLSARVRDELWAKIEQEKKCASALMIFTANTEQGFAIRFTGDSRRVPLDLDGVTLIRYLYRTDMPEREADM